MPDLGFSRHFFKKGHYTVLLVSLGLFLFVLHPLLVGHPLLLLLLRIGFMFVLFSACYAVASDRRAFRIALILAILTAASSWAGDLWHYDFLVHLSNFFAIAFFLWIAVLLLRHVLGDEPVTLDKLFGAICVYMLFGLMWAEIFGLLHALDPATFTFNDSLRMELESVRSGVPASVFIYYSFVTLTTLGYGDISPVSMMARSMASLEAIVGPLYLAILIARLVSLMDTRSKPQDPSRR
jgi:hypothetical protein